MSLVAVTFRLQVLSSSQEISQIAPAWDELAALSGYPTSAASWYENACRFAHSSCDQPHIIVLWDGERLAGIAPLIVRHAPHGRRYEVIGTSTLYEPAAILARNNEAAAQLALAVVSLKQPLALIRLTDATAFNDAFIRYARRAGLVRCPPTSGSPYVDLRSGWEPYFEGLPSRLKNVIRRAHRQLGKTGRLEFEFIKPDATNVTLVLQQAFEVELQSWKRLAGSAVLLRTDLREFFFHYAADLARRGELLVSFLRLDGVPVAMQVASVSHRAYWQLKIGYDER
ncbi:MAG: GNAT family N-acetyltransferase, partial [Candidatus Obscuribacterales bacterium]|nr:GNAT family N-acetyltransferase [Steroidobacteraceae bacterium]